MGVGALITSIIYLNIFWVLTHENASVDAQITPQQEQRYCPDREYPHQLLDQDAINVDIHLGFTSA
jgi:hypothetical protein